MLACYRCVSYQREAAGFIPRAKLRLAAFSVAEKFPKKKKKEGGKKERRERGKYNVLCITERISGTVIKEAEIPVRDPIIDRRSERSSISLRLHRNHAITITVIVMATGAWRAVAPMGRKIDKSLE